MQPSRRFFLTIIIGSLAITALLGITAILTSALGDIGTKVLITTVAIDIASVLGLCCAGKTATALHRVVQLVGLTSAAVALLLSIFIIWNTAAAFHDGLIWRAMYVAVVLAIASAHACLLLPSIALVNSALRIVTTLTLSCILVVAVLIANYALIPNFNPGDTYGKAIAVVLILDVLGTITIPLVRRFGSVPTPVEAAAPEVSATPEGTITPDNDVS